MTTLAEMNVRLDADTVEMQRKMAEASQSIDRFQRDASERLSRFDAAMDRAGEVTATLGRRLLALAGITSFGAVIEDAIRAQSALSDTMREIEMMGRTSEAGMAFVREELSRLADQLPMGYQALADSLKQMTLEGLTAAQGARVLGDAMRLAQTGMVDTNTAVSMTVEALRGAGVAAADLGGYFDRLVNVSRTFGVPLAELQSALYEIGPTARQAGQDMGALLPVAAELAQGWDDARLAGTAIAEVIKSLSEPTLAQAKAQAELGIATRDAAGALRPIVDIAEDVARANATAEQAMRAFGSNGARALGELSRDIGSFKEKAASADGFGGVAEAISGREGSLTKALSDLREEWQTFGLTLENEKVEDKMASAVRGMTASLGVLKGFLSDIALQLFGLDGVELQTLKDRAEAVREALQRPILGDLGQEKMRQELLDLEGEIVLRAARIGAGAIEADLPAAPRTDKDTPLGGGAGDQSRDRVAEALRQLERQIAGERLKAEAVGATRSEQARLNALAQTYQSLADAGVTLTQKQRAEIEALGLALEQATATTITMQDQLARVQEVGTTLARGLEDAWLQFIRTGKLSMDEFAASVLTQISQIALRAAILQPLFGGGANGGTGLFGDLVGSVAGTLFGGARADGGPVNAGMAYLVGERGPELVVPRGDAFVMPTGTFGGGASVSISMPVDARGADPASIARLEAALAEQRRALPGIAVAAVRDAQARGQIR